VSRVSPERLSIGVVGGSLGGLTAACLLRDASHDVSVYERSSRELEQRGAGIGLLQTTSRYLVERAGVSIDEISTTTRHIRHLRRDGSLEHESAHRYRFSSWNTVYRRLLDHWQPSPYELGSDMVDFKQRTDNARAGVEISFASGHSTSVDLLVCADGVGSLARTKLQPRALEGYVGYVAWRGMVPEADLASDVAATLTDAITYYVYANSHILVYPIPGLDGSVEPGERLINFVWYRNYLAGADFDDLMIDNTGVRRQMSLPPGSVSAHHSAEVRAHASARLPKVLAAVVEATDELFVQVVYDIEVERMAFGRVCLIGDAAFAVRPHAAAGTAKAADDAWTLAAALDSRTTIEEALAGWESTQLALGRKLLDRTRRVGRRSQVDNSWTPGDPELNFGLHAPGDS
jgi:2,6-dihydroxypyridine 3-monooxygenase